MFHSDFTKSATKKTKVSTKSTTVSHNTYRMPGQPTKLPMEATNPDCKVAPANHFTRLVMFFVQKYTKNFASRQKKRFYTEAVRNNIPKFEAKLRNRMKQKIKSLQDLKDLAVSNGKKKLVLCAAGDEHSIDAVYDAYRAGVIDPILVGQKEEIEKYAKNCKDFDKFTVYYEIDEEHVIRRSVELVVNGQADILMKGNVTTAALLRGVLNKEYGLKEKRFLSHFALFEIPNYHKLLGITDVALNILPPLKHKVQIVKNAINFVRSIGIEKPKIAALSAIEMVNEDMPSTIDAALLSIMQRRGQIKNCLIDGPLAFDNAISKLSKEQKNIPGDVAGDADILLVPNIESGNILYKAFVFFADAKVAGVVVGAPFPIVLTSRADSEETKLNSIYMAAFSVKKS